MQAAVGWVAEVIEMIVVAVLLLLLHYFQNSHQLFLALASLALTSIIWRGLTFVIRFQLREDRGGKGNDFFLGKVFD